MQVELLPELTVKIYGCEIPVYVQFGLGLQTGKKSLEEMVNTLPVLYWQAQVWEEVERILYASPQFLSWKDSVDLDLAQHLVSITLQGVDYFGETTLGFIKIATEIEREVADPETGEIQTIRYTKTSLLGGDAVNVTIVLTAAETGEKYVVLVEQERAAQGSWNYLEIPAGLIEGAELVSRAVAEVEEETGLVIEVKDLQPLMALAGFDSLHIATSSGILAQRATPYLYEKTLPLPEIQAIHAKAAGKHDEHESIRVHIATFAEAKALANNGHTVTGLSLYELYILKNSLGNFFQEAETVISRG